MPKKTILIVLFVFLSQNILAENEKLIVPDCQLVLSSAIADIHLGIHHPLSGENVLLNLTCSNIKSEEAICTGFYAKGMGFNSKRITDGHFKHLQNLKIASQTHETLKIVSRRYIIYINWLERLVTWKVGPNTSIGSCKTIFLLESK